MKEVSQLLVTAIDPQTGELARGWTKDEVDELVRAATVEFWASKLGQQLLERGGDGIEDQVIDIMAHRYAQTNFALAPFCEVLQEVGRDVLLGLPAPVAPKVAPAPKPAPVVTLEMRAKEEAEAKAKAEADSKLRQFGHMINECILNFGVQSLKPKAGYVAVRLLNGRVYEYESQQFENMYQSALDARLIH